MSKNLSRVIDADVIVLGTFFAASYLVRGTRGWTLIDTDLPGYGEYFLWNLSQLQIKPDEIKSILLTHDHIDHAGSAQQIRQFTRAKIGLCKFDTPVASVMKSVPKITGPLGKIKHYFLNMLVNSLPKPVFDIDFELYDNQDLSNLGLNGFVIGTPGHTNGSVSFVLHNKFVFVGDVFQTIRQKIIPNNFADNFVENLASISKLRPFQNFEFMPGHKYPFHGKEVFEHAN